MVFGSEDHNKIGSVYQNSTKTSINNLNKLIILTFGDISQTQYTNAKPILDKYDFKGSFFVTCGWVGGQWHRIHQGQVPHRLSTPLKFYRAQR